MTEYIYDYEARLRRDRSLRRPKDLPNGRLPKQDYEVKLRKFRERLKESDKNRAVPVFSNQKLTALPKCPVCNKILFVNGRCPDNCRF